VAEPRRRIGKWTNWREEVVPVLFSGGGEGDAEDVCNTAIAMNANGNNAFIELIELTYTIRLTPRQPFSSPFPKLKSCN
jgi:hypothetical protein